MTTKTTQKPDKILKAIAEYASEYVIKSDEAYQTARACLADSLGCAMLALNFPECTKLLGPIVPGTTVDNGVHVPGTAYILDPVQGAFNIGTMIRWLDFNDAWLAAEWGHPSDNLGAILSISDYISRGNIAKKKPALKIEQVLTALIKAHEIQGVLALENSFNRVGLDHVILVKVASAAVTTALLGGTTDQIMDSVSNAWIDSSPLRTYRHKPNTGSRKSWAAGDATSRAVFLSYLTMKGEKGYKTALTAPTWGFSDAILDGKPIVLKRPLGSYVMENVLFKVAFPAEFHAQTAVECAIKLHPQVKDRLNDIDSILIETHESAIRIIDKQGPLNNPADRDHCLQYMIAIGLIKGNLTADDYEDKASRDARIDILRKKMYVIENKRYTKDYLLASKRSVANALTIKFKDGTALPKVAVEYPYGHKKRRQEGLPLLFEKFERNLATRFPSSRVKTLLSLFQDHEKLLNTSACKLIDLFSGG